MATTKSKKSTQPDSDSNADKKVFDVAKPGSSEPSTGTKPMVIGHKTMTSDPSMIEAKETPTKDKEEDDTATEPTIKLSASKKLTLQPLSKSDTETDDDKKTTAIAVSEVETSESTEDDDQEKQKTSSELEKEHQVKIDEREQKLGELIKSGQYNVVIKESNGFNFKVFLSYIFQNIFYI